MAAKASKVFQLLVGLHALGDDLQFQPVGHGDDGIHNASAVVAAANGLYEGLVDLQGMDREAVEVIQ